MPSGKTHRLINGLLGPLALLSVLFLPLLVVALPVLVVMVIVWAQREARAYESLRRADESLLLRAPARAAATVELPAQDSGRSASLDTPRPSRDTWRPQTYARPAALDGPGGTRLPAWIGEEAPAPGPPRVRVELVPRREPMRVQAEAVLVDDLDVELDDMELHDPEPALVPVWPELPSWWFSWWGRLTYNLSSIIWAPIPVNLLALMLFTTAPVLAGMLWPLGLLAPFVAIFLHERKARQVAPWEPVPDAEGRVQMRESGASRYVLATRRGAGRVWIPAERWAWVVPAVAAELAGRTVEGRAAQRVAAYLGEWQAQHPPAG